MKRKLGLGYVGAALLLFTFILTGCSDSSSSESSDVTEITLWHMEQPPHRVKTFKKVIEKFNSQNSDIKINPQVQSWDDAYSKFPAAIQAGNGPDLLFTLPDYTTLIKDLGVVQPVDEMVGKLEKEYNFLDSSLAPYKYDGHTWAVPIYGMVQALWYRKGIFEEENLQPPQNWKDLTETAETLTQGDVNGIALPASKSLATDQVLYSFLISAGAKDIIDENNNVTFNKPETVKAFKKYKELLQYSPNDSNTYTWGEPQAQFNSGKAAMAIEKGQYLAPFEDESGQSSDKLGVVPMPVAEGGEEGSIYYSNGIMMLTEDKKKQQAIEKFFAYLYKPKNYAEFINAEPGLFLPVTEAASQSEEYWNNPVISQYEKQVKTLIEVSKNGALFGFTNGVSNEVGQISGPNILAQTLQQMITKGMSAEEAVKWGEEQMEKAVE